MCPTGEATRCRLLRRCWSVSGHPAVPGCACAPPPQPSPTRGEGAHRECGPLLPETNALLPARKQRQQQDAQVKPERPVVDVTVIAIDAAFHLSSVSVSPRKPLTCAQPVMPGSTLCRRAQSAIVCSYSRLCHSGRGPTERQRSGRDAPRKRTHYAHLELCRV